LSEARALSGQYFYTTLLDFPAMLCTIQAHLLGARPQLSLAHGSEWQAAPLQLVPSQSL
jgi:hypothetical protein